MAVYYWFAAACDALLDALSDWLLHDWRSLPIMVLIVLLAIQGPMSAIVAIVLLYGVVGVVAWQHRGA